MTFTLDEGVFEFLSIAKEIYDGGLMDKVLENCGNLDVCEEYYCIAWEGIAAAFQRFRQYYNEEKEIATMVFFDPVITEFYRLCGLYERQKGIADKDNSFRQKGEQEVYQCFTLDAYCYDVLLYDGRRGKPRLVILAGEEFYGHGELPGVLAEVRDTFKAYCEQLKRELAAEKPAMIMPKIQKREAA